MVSIFVSFYLNRNLFPSNSLCKKGFLHLEQQQEALKNTIKKTHEKLSCSYPVHSRSYQSGYPNPERRTEHEQEGTDGQ